MIHWLLSVNWYFRDDCSRTKLRPDAELERARKKVLECKLAIRSAMQSLHLSSIEGALHSDDMDVQGCITHDKVSLTIRGGPVGLLAG